MPNPAVIQDLEDRWRPLVGQERTNGDTFLTDAWGMLNRHMTRLGVDLDEQMVEDPTLADEVTRILCTAVLRVLKNPEGKRQEAIDDYSWTRDQAVSAGLLYFSDEELNDLAPGSAGSGGAFSVNLLAGWCPQ